MGKTSKNKGRLVTLGDSAYSFFNAATGIHFVKGESKRLTPHQLSNAQIKRALHNGHLQFVLDESEGKKINNTPETTEDLVKKLSVMYEKGMEPSKIAQGFTDEQVDSMANHYGLSRDEGENSEEVIKAIIEQL